jgi:YD repeat-containing protein
MSQQTKTDHSAPSDVSRLTPQATGWPSEYRTNYNYDLNGNLLTDGKRGFDYDDENQLIRVTVTNAWKTEFTYDGKMRRRIKKDYSWNGSSWLQTNEVRYVYDGNLVVQERNANNLPQVSYTRGNDLSGTLQGAGGIGGLSGHQVVVQVR